MGISHSEAYAAAGVDIEAGYQGVKMMNRYVQRTLTANVISDLGGFGGLFSLDLHGLEKPVLVSGTDGVGTKQRIAQLMDRHNTVGIDCVAMCVNDIICCGAKPLFFLDYIAIGKNIPEKVVSLAGSMIAASGSALSPAFAELMKQGKGSLLRVENFRCHEGGGLIAMVDGVEVYCGSASFMHLMGVHLPDMFKIKNCVYVSEGDTICGMFQMEYTPVDSVRDALYMLMRSDRHPVFAVRDFNITPQLLSVKYDIPTDGFDFPSFAQRYEISGAEPSEASKPAALVSREGLGAFVHLAEHAKGLYTRVRVSVMLSVMSTVIGMIVMFILSLTGQMTVTAALSFLLVWLIPVLVIGFCFSE